MNKNMKITGVIIIIIIIVVIIFLLLYGFDEQKTSKKSCKDTIEIKNSCSGNINGTLDFEVHKDNSMSNIIYKTSYNISIKEGKTETYIITIPEEINCAYSNMNLYVSCKDNSTTHFRSGPWVYYELYEISETANGIDCEWVDFDM